MFVKLGLFYFRSIRSHTGPEVVAASTFPPRFRDNRITVRTLHYKKPPRIILKLQSLNFTTIPVYKSSEKFEEYRSLRDNNLKQN